MFFFPVVLRLKDFTFEHRSFTMELPKSMLLADVAVRVMYPTYDLLTPRGRSYRYKNSAPSPRRSKAAPAEAREIAGSRKGSGRSQEGEKAQEGADLDQTNGKQDKERVGHCG